MQTNTREQAAARRIQTSWRHHFYVANKKAAAQLNLRHAAALELDFKRKTRKQVCNILCYVLFLFFFSAGSIWVVQVLLCVGGPNTPLCDTAPNPFPCQDQDIFHMGDAIKQQLMFNEFDQRHVHVEKTLLDVGNAVELYQWMQGPLYATLWTPATWPDPSDTRLQGTLFGTTYLVGGVRVSTLRVRERPCPDLKGMVMASPMACYGESAKGEFSEDVESRASFGAGGNFTWQGA